MRAVLTAVIAAIEAMAVALAVFAAVALPAVLIWWLTFDLAAEPLQLLAIVSSLWQLAHLIPMQIVVDPQMALGLGLGSETLSFTLSLAPLSLTLVTATLAFRSAWRFAAKGSAGAWAVLGGALGFGTAAALVASSIPEQAARPLWASILVPALVYTVPAAFGLVLRAALDRHEWWQTAVRLMQRPTQQSAPLFTAALPERAAETLRLAGAAVMALLGLSGLGTAVAILVGYVDAVTLSQGLQLDAFGALMLFLVQLALLPVFWVWALSWFAGPGFSIGIATSVSPFETLLGPLPALPVLGALPQGWGWAGALAPALIVAIGAALGGLASGRPVMRRSPARVVLGVTLLAAVLVGLVVVLLSALASGSVGPGRLAEVGPSPWPVGVFVALELAFGMSLGAFARRLDRDRLDEVLVGLAPAAREQSRGAALGEDPRVGEVSGGNTGYRARRSASDVDPMAETQPLQPLERVLADDSAVDATVDTVTAAGDDSAAIRGAGSLGDAAAIQGDPEAETRPIEPLPGSAPQPPVPSRPPERSQRLALFLRSVPGLLPDRAPVPRRDAPAAPAAGVRTGSEHAGGSETHSGQSTGEPSPEEPSPEEPSPEESSTDPLLQAYSWDAGGSPAADPKPRSWRDRLRSRSDER